MKDSALLLNHMFFSRLHVFHLFFLSHILQHVWYISYFFLEFTPSRLSRHSCAPPFSKLAYLVFASSYQSSLHSFPNIYKTPVYHQQLIFLHNSIPWPLFFNIIQLEIRHVLKRPCYFVINSLCCFLGNITNKYRVGGKNVFT